MEQKHKNQVLVVLASNQRRGAEITGIGLTRTLNDLGTPTSVVALTESTHGHTLDVPALGASPFSRRTLSDLRKLARRHHVVIAYGSTALPACSIALAGTRTPFIYRSIGDPASWVRGPAHRARTRLLFRRAAHVVVMSDEAARSIERLYGVRANDITVIPGARFTEDFPPRTAESRSAARKWLGLNDDAHVAVIVGSLTEEKRVDLALETISRIDDAILLVVGDGPLRADLERVASDVDGNRVHFLGQLVDVVPVLHAADALLLTSRTEGIPGAIIEAGLAGLPAVATDVGAVRSVIADGETGRLVPAADVSALVAGLSAAFEMSAEVGARARERMLAQQTWEAVGPRWVTLLARWLD